jgi:hypothetical protein
MYEIQVYDRNSFPTDWVFWSAVLTIFLLAGGCYLIDTWGYAVPNIIFYTLFALLILVGSLEAVQSWRIYMPNDTVTLRVSENAIEFGAKRVNLSNVKSIIIQLKNKNIQYAHIADNYLEIRTQSGVTYKLGIVIGQREDVTQVEKICAFLSTKVKNCDIR